MNREDFRDKRYWGLGNSVIKAIELIAQSDPESVISKIAERRAGYRNEEETARFLTFILGEVKNQYERELDEAWSVKQVKEYCCCTCFL